MWVHKHFHQPGAMINQLFSKLFDGPIRRFELAERKRWGEKLLDEALYGSPANCLALVNKGADLTLTNKAGYTALHLVLETGLRSSSQPHLPLVRALMDPQRPDSHFAAHHKNHMGETPLHLAASCASQEACELLLVAGSDVNAQNHRGEAPLHCAAKSKAPPICSLLLSHKGDPRLTDVMGHTPAEVARASGSSACAQEIDAFVHSLCAMEAIEGIMAKIHESPPTGRAMARPSLRQC